MSTGINTNMKKSMILFLLCGCVNSNQYQTELNVDPLQPVYTADAMVGLNERTNRKELKAFMGIDPVHYEWCAAFVNAILHLHGIPGSESVSDYPLMARSFTYWGRYAERPEIGDIVVFPRGNTSWQGHVGFYVMSTYIDNIEYFVILGGNQNNEVSYELYAASKAIAIRKWHEE